MKPESKPYALGSRQKKFGVDRNAGVITGVSLITAGVEAKGHGFVIDQKTLTTALAVLNEKGERMKAAISHLSWADWWAGETDRIMEYPGWFSGFSISGNQLVAEKLEFYDTFKTDEPRLFARLLEIAEKTPDLIGVSLEPWGYLVFVGKDGTEYSERPRDVELQHDGMPAFRVTDLTYGALVDDPAANPGGLFAKLSRRLGDSELVAVLRHLFAGEQRETKPAKKDDAPPSAPDLSKGKSEPAKPLVPSPATNVPLSANSVMKDLIEKIRAEFGAAKDKARFSRAMTIVGEKPEISFSDLKVEMLNQENVELQAQVTTLTTDKTALDAKIVTLTTERDQWKEKFEKIKGSGAEDEVSLGAISGGAGGTTEENPWQPGKENLARQCEIEGKNPALAATLKAAAKGIKPAAPAQTK